VKTTFSAERMDYSKRAHLAAQQQFYSHMFPGLPLTFEDTVSTVRDLDYAVDCIASVTRDELRAPLLFPIQERWRDPQFMGHGDVTVTEWNLLTNLPSELHKLGAHLFVYGFYDSSEDRIVAAVAVNVPTLLLALTLQKISYTRCSREDQTFLAFPVRELRSIGAVVFSACRGVFTEGGSV
jgi:hypothetical protein